MSRITTWLIPSVLALAAAGWFLGESVDSSIGIRIEIAVLIAFPISSAVAAFRLLRGAKVTNRIFFTRVAAALVRASVLAGQQCFTRAYNDCVSKAESIRTSFEAYRSSHGRYPDNIREAFVRAPYSRCMRGSILCYSGSDKHFVVSFSDRIVSWEATNQSAWFRKDR